MLLIAGAVPVLIIYAMYVMNTGTQLSFETLAVPLGLLGVWAAVDFSSAFAFFHELLFTNDLWLLDPRTDLLIRICPSSMFAQMGLRIGLRAAAALLGIPGLLTALFKLSQRKRKQNENAEL